MLGNNPLPRLVFKKHSPKSNKTLNRIANKTFYDSYKSNHSGRKHFAKQRDLSSNQTLKSSMLLYVPHTKIKTNLLKLSRPK